MVLLVCCLFCCVSLVQMTTRMAMVPESSRFESRQVKSDGRDWELGGASSPIQSSSDGVRVERCRLRACLPVRLSACPPTPQPRLRVGSLSARTPANHDLSGFSIITALLLLNASRHVTAMGAQKIMLW